jgi:hypothetical protein
MNEASTRQRLATYLAIVLTAVALAAGLLLRVNIENASFLFTDSRTGIRLRYPANWILERGSADGPFIMRVEDPAALPFKTSLSISALATGPDSTINDITTLIDITRAGQLASYKSLDISPTTLGGRPATQLTYAYATTETNPSLRSLPVIVRGVDIIVLSRSQTFVLTFLSEATAYDSNQRYLDLFLRNLEFLN